MRQRDDHVDAPPNPMGGGGDSWRVVAMMGGTQRHTDAQNRVLAMNTGTSDTRTQTHTETQAQAQAQGRGKGPERPPLVMRAAVMSS